MYFKSFFTSIIGEILYKNTKSILFVYALIAIEAILSILMPTAVGAMINSLLDHIGYGELMFILFYITYHLTALVRRIQDTKTYTLIYTQLVVNYIQTTTVKDFSIINARVDLLKQVVSFFENDLPVFINCVITIIGSAIILYYYSPKLLLISLIIIIPSFVINQYYFKKINVITQKINDTYENQLNIIKESNPIQINFFFNKLRNQNIIKSNQEAYNYAFLEIFVFIMIFFSVITICKLENVKTGTIVASYAIILKFAYSFDFIPFMTTKIASIKDIIKRLNI